LLELTSRAAEQAGLPLRLRVQVRSFGAMCQMIGANLGIGVLPIAACGPEVAALKLKTLQLTDSWATRRLLVATKAEGPLAPASELLVQHLKQQSERTDDGEHHN
jgi:DNA-binding transcriptional LysR family regulator